ncbi:MAG: SpoIIE family protein phosphatase [Erysipelotrichaceae bacterium]
MIETRVKAAYRSLTKVHEELCGDDVQMRNDEKCFVLVLADGLGSGVKANILATLSATIIGEMLIQGMDLSEAVSTLVATLPECEERHIAYATFAALTIHLNGKAQLAEFDHPQSALFRNLHELPIERTSSVIEGKTIFEARFDVFPDDILLCFSDGVEHAGLGNVLNFGWTRKEIIRSTEELLSHSIDPVLLTNRLIAQVDALYHGEAGDDATVAFCKVTGNEETSILVGPPSKIEQDHQVVYEWLSHPGMKVVCGGSTASMVARELNEELTVGEIFPDAGIPPMANIRGVNLVTEGVLTLSRTRDLLRHASLNANAFQKLISDESPDAATRLARLLLEGPVKIRFMLGLSENPAHQAEKSLMISLNAKLNLVREISEELRKHLKLVTIEMY